MVSDLIGDVRPDPDQVLGLFHRDSATFPAGSSRSTAAAWRPCPTAPQATRRLPSFLPVGPYRVPQSHSSVIRERALGKGSGEDLHEKLTVVNSGREELLIELSMTFDADFADLFEVKNKQLIKKGTTSRRVRGQQVELSYQREDFERRTIVHANGARLSQGSADFLLRLKPAESWSGTPCGSHSSPSRHARGQVPHLTRALPRSSAPRA